MTQQQNGVSTSTSEYVVLRLMRSYLDTNQIRQDPMVTAKALEALTSLFEASFYVTAHHQNVQNQPAPKIGFPKSAPLKVEPQQVEEDVDAKQFVLKALQQQEFVNSELIPTEFVERQTDTKLLKAEQEVENDFELGKLMFDFPFEGDIVGVRKLNIFKTPVTAPSRSWYGTYGMGDAVQEIIWQGK